MTTNYSEQKFDSKLELQNKLKEENLTMVVLSLNTIGENLNIVGDSLNTGGKNLKMVGFSLNMVGDSLNMVRDSLNIVVDDKVPMPTNEQEDLNRAYYTCANGADTGSNISIRAYYTCANWVR